MRAGRTRGEPQGGPGTTTSRTLVLDLDTLHQADRWRGAPGPDAPSRGTAPALDAVGAVDPASRRWFAGVLRTADLFSDTVLLTDNQVLDGAWLLHAGPDGVERLLGRASIERAPFHVVARDDDLGEALRAMALDRRTGLLTGFEWSCLTSFGVAPLPGGSLRGHDPGDLARCTSDDVPFVLAALLEGASDGGPVTGGPSGEHLALAESWAAWVSAARRGRVPVHRWDPARYALPEHLAALDGAGAAPTAVPGDVLGAARACTRRSDLRALLTRTDGRLTPDARRAVEQWWVEAYFRALAAQHEATWLRLGPASPTIGDGEAAPTPADAIRLEGRSVEILGAMPGAAYATLRHRARDAVAAWVHAPGQRTADALGYAIRAADDQLDLHGDRRDAYRRLVLAAAPAVVAALVSTVATSWAGLWTGLATAVTVLVAIPAVDVVELHRTRPSRMRAYLHVPGLRRD